jgi:hypothetical protein
MEKKKPHPQPLSEPAVTDRREVMERGVVTDIPYKIDWYYRLILYLLVSSIGVSR